MRKLRSRFGTCDIFELLPPVNPLRVDNSIFAHVCAYSLIFNVFQHLEGVPGSSDTHNGYTLNGHIYCIARRRMNSEYSDRGSDGLASLHEHHGPYEPSIASSASSSQVSVFSDTLSASSSIASSVSDDFRYTHDDARERDRICAQAQLRFQAQTNNQQLEEPAVLGNLLKGNGQCMSYADVTSVPAPQRQHPRRTSLSRNQRPPPLVRQRDRKINFVDNLVGKHIETSET